MNILITGGAGFIGSHVAEYFHVEGHEVFILDNFSTGNLKNIPFINEDNIFNLDIREYKKVEEIVQQYQFEIIIHLAAVVSVVDTVKDPITSNQVNVDATLNLLDINRQFNNNIKRIIFASSAAVYGNDPSLPKRIDSMIYPESPYAIQKYASEQYLKLYNNLYNLPTVSLRFFNVYGPRQNPKSPYSGVLSIMKNKFDTDETFTFNGDGLQTRDFVYVKDIVNAISLVSSNENAAGNIYNIGSGVANTLVKIFKTFQSNYNKEINYTYEKERLGDVKHSLADIRAIEELGYTPNYPIEKGLAEYLQSENKTTQKV